MQKEFAKLGCLRTLMEGNDSLNPKAMKITVYRGFKSFHCKKPFSVAFENICPKEKMKLAQNVITGQLL